MADPMDVHVQVFLHPGDPRGDFHFETTDLPMGADNVLFFKNCGHPGFYIHYDLQDPTNGYLFPESSLFPPNPPKQNLKAAIWCQQNPGCPAAPSQWGQFSGRDVTNGGKTLVVHNKNQSPQDFGYTLRVTNDGGASYLPLDPGGTNQNGPARNFTVAAGVAVGAIAGSVITLGAQALLK